MREQSGFKDHFSGHAEDYARFRPGYPVELFAWLAQEAPDLELAWDAGTGNGQVARGLARFFTRVHASDASGEQLDRARGPASIRFVVEPAEACSLGDASADLVTAGQALHWFDLPRFYTEADRVLRPGGLFAAWTYQLNEITPAIDQAIERFYDTVIGPYWPPERAHVEQGYRDLSFPYEELEAPPFRLHSDWNLDRYLGYVDTWSAVRRYRARTGDEPMPALKAELTSLWGPGTQPVTWPLALRAGRKPRKPAAA